MENSLKNRFFRFCALCHNLVDGRRKYHFCPRHEPGGYRYIRDRELLKSRLSDKWPTTEGHRAKIAALSNELDLLSTNPRDVIVKKFIRNGVLAKKSITKPLQEHYPTAAGRIDFSYFDLRYKARVLRGFFHALEMQQSDDFWFLKSIDETDFIKVILIVSARFEAYSNLRREAERRSNKADEKIIEKNVIMKILSLPRKANGRISRSDVASELQISRWAAGRLISKLKRNGDINGDI